MKRIWFIGLTLALTLSHPAPAVTPTLWRDDTFAEFEKGEIQGVSVNADGSVTLSQSVEEYADTKALHVWSLARDTQGNLYAGTGNEGKVFRVGPDRKADLLCALPDARIVHALAIDAGGVVYAGTSPGGAVYRVAPGKAPALVCSTGARFVWALAFTPQGELYAGTGGGGKILRISPSGKVTEVGASSDEHVVSLVAGKDGALYAGTEGNGLVYRVEKDRMQVLYDAPEHEVRGLAVGADGALYAGAMSGAVRLEEGKDEPPRPRPEGGGAEERSSLYRISPSGAALKLWESAQPLLLSALVERDGRALVATGDKGLCYRVGDDGAAAVVAQFEDFQPLTLCAGREGEVFVGVGGAGKVYRMWKGGATAGTFTSRRYDFGSGARWGKVAWRAETPAGTSVSVQTRSGNTEKSDDGWSDWSADLKDAAGSQIASPPGRFLQYRVRLTAGAGGVAPALREVSAAGLQENLRPKISALEVIPPGRNRPSPEGGPPPSRGPQGGQGGGGNPKPGPASKRGIQTIQWAASDPNGDDLTYAIYVRGIDETGWRLVEKDLKTTSHAWNTESTPDGTTLIRVVASDLPDNPEALALTAERVSEPFEVDNTPPRVASLRAVPDGGGAFRIEGSASDETSPLRGGEYAVDSGDWRAFFPSDGIFDSRIEAFSFKVTGLSGGNPIVLVRVTDALENVGVGKVVIRAGTK